MIKWLRNKHFLHKWSNWTQYTVQMVYMDKQWPHELRGEEVKQFRKCKICGKEEHVNL